MPRPTHYSPAIERFLVSVLYHEARHRSIPMTRLANEILKSGLAQSAGWQLALKSLNSQAPPDHRVTPLPLPPATQTREITSTERNHI
jgi:hypothetical protein